MEAKLRFQLHTPNDVCGPCCHLKIFRYLWNGTDLPIFGQKGKAKLLVRSILGDEDTDDMLWASKFCEKANDSDSWAMAEHIECFSFDEEEVLPILGRLGEWRGAWVSMVVAAGWYIQKFINWIA